eukprot:scaffold139414_cov57-Attheya_sp.AAC.2
MDYPIQPCYCMYDKRIKNLSLRSATYGRQPILISTSSVFALRVLPFFVSDEETRRSQGVKRALRRTATTDGLDGWVVRTRAVTGCEFASRGLFFFNLCL